jgi:hypothetical protein
MPVTILKNNAGKLVSKTTFTNSAGWWNRIEAADLDNDGDLDLVVGNFGLNNQLKPTAKEPVTMLYGDFDQNGALDPFLGYYIQGNAYPLASRDEALNQLFVLRRKFTTYQAYADATLGGLFSSEQLAKADTLLATEFRSGVFENKGGGQFDWHPLPVEAQAAPAYALALVDLNADGLKDLLVAGNQQYTRIKIGKMDANYGMVFLNQGKCQFQFIPQQASGFWIKGDVRDLVVIPQKEGVSILVGRNNESIQVYRSNQVIK